MVIRIGRLPAWVMLLVMLSLPLSIAEANSTGDERFSVHIDKERVEYGKSIRLTVRSTGDNADLDTRMLSDLQQHFAIEAITRDRQSNGTTRQWRLYPRRPGQLTLPALHYRDHKSDPIALTVTPAVDPRDGQPIHITTDIPDTRVWLRQAVPLSMTLETGSSIIVLRRDNAAHEALDIRELATTQQPVKEKPERYRHTTGWVAHPLRQGRHRLQLPPLNYVRDGVTTHRFYPPLLQLEARPLPAYLPPSMPVGRLSFKIDRPARFLLTDALRHMQLTIHGQGIRARDMPQLHRQLRSSAGITLYPAQLTQRTSTEDGNLISHTVYEIPLTVKQSGRVTLPELRLDYFEPQTGRIVSLKTDAQSIYALNRWLFYLLIGILMIALWLGIHRLLPLMQHRIRRLHGYIRVLALLPQADSDEVVVKLLRELAAKEGWPANLTLAHWRQCWQNHYAPDTRIDQALEALMLKRYAGQPLDIRPIREQLYTALSRQKRTADWISRLTPVNA